MNDTMDGGFVIVGYRDRGGTVVLMASEKLLDGEFTTGRDYDGLHMWGDPQVVRHVPRPVEHQLLIKMRGYVQVTGATYPQAWAKLFDVLSPPAWQSDQEKSQILSHYVFTEGSRRV